MAPVLRCKHELEPAVDSPFARPSLAGYVTGLILNMLGFRSLGNPFPGWTTEYEVFDFLREVRKEEAIDVARKFIFGDSPTGTLNQCPGT
ncbi:MAG TPA: hypothetical protein VMH22_09505 [bacterium]|nr:hypothetical protein [bacterium]